MSSFCSSRSSIRMNTFHFLFASSVCLWLLLKEVHVVAELHLISFRSNFLCFHKPCYCKTCLYVLAFYNNFSVNVFFILSPSLKYIFECAYELCKIISETIKPCSQHLRSISKRQKDKLPCNRSWRPIRL
jgi:hypothetical protein